VLLLYTLKESFAIQPSAISKVNTAVQIAFAAVVLAYFGLDLTGPPLDLTAVMQAGIWITAATTLLSMMIYLVMGMRLLNRLGGTK
jgi:cardiolipin synthase